MSAMAAQHDGAMKFRPLPALIDLAMDGYAVKVLTLTC